MNKSLVKIMVVIVGVMLLFSIFSCGKSEKKVLRVGTNAEYPPFEYKKEGKFEGIDIRLAELIANKLNMELKINDMDFDSLIPAVKANKVDLAMAAITITDSRKEQVDFSIPYYHVDQAIIAPKKESYNIEDENDLTEYSIGAQNGTTGQIYIDDKFVKKDKMDKDKLKKYPTNIEAMTDMLNGNTDLVIIDTSAAKGYMAKKPIKIIYTIKTGENYGISMSKNYELKPKINKALKEILKSDQWTKILNKYMSHKYD